MTTVYLVNPTLVAAAPQTAKNAAVKHFIFGVVVGAAGIIYLAQKRSQRPQKG